MFRGLRPPSLMAVYLATALALVALYPVLPAGHARDLDFLVVALGALWPLLRALSRARAYDRRPWWFVLGAMVLLDMQNTLWYLARNLPPISGVYDTVGLGCGVLGTLLMLAGVISVVVRRGHNDVGGIIDTTVVAMALGSILWDFVLLPHLQATQIGLPGQVSKFIAVFALTGVLGALARLLQTAREFILSLWLLSTALALSLVANVALTLTGNAGAGLDWANVSYMVTYTAIAGVGLSRSTAVMLRPGPTPRDDLTPARLAFLGISLASVPVVGGMVSLLGKQVDGLLLTLGGTAIIPLVMVRIGRLAAQRARAERALLHEATHDALTGLPNRREFMARLTAELDRSRDEPTGPVILFCDLDGFKAVNDRLGHAAGDQVLVEVAARLRRSVREGDVVGRFAGDEFLVLCRESTPADAPEVIRRIGEALASPIDIADEAVRVGASVGAVTADPGADAETLIKRADAAMYEAKQHRKARRGEPITA